MNPRASGLPNSGQPSRPAESAPRLPRPLPDRGSRRPRHSCRTRLWALLSTGSTLPGRGSSPSTPSTARAPSTSWTPVPHCRRQAAPPSAPSSPRTATPPGPTCGGIWPHEALDRGWRVIAPDHLDMGFSERLPHDRAPRPADAGIRRIADRVADFDAVVTALLAEGSSHRVVTIGHDWGGSHLAHVGRSQSGPRRCGDHAQHRRAPGGGQASARVAHRCTRGTGAAHLHGRTRTCSCGPPWPWRATR